MDGFLTEGGRTTPSELAKDKYSGMLSRWWMGSSFEGGPFHGRGRRETDGLFSLGSLVL